MQTESYSLDTINSWRNLGKLGPVHKDFYKGLYLSKLKRRSIQDIAERRKSKVVVDGIEVWLPRKSEGNLADWKR